MKKEQGKDPIFFPSFDKGGKRGLMRRDREKRKKPRCYLGREKEL